MALSAHYLHLVPHATVYFLIASFPSVFSSFLYTIINLSHLTNGMILSTFPAGESWEHFTFLSPDSSLVLYSLYLLQLGPWLGVCYVQSDQQPHPSTACSPAGCKLFGKGTAKAWAFTASPCLPVQFL